MTTDNIITIFIAILVPILPTLFLILGGQYLLDRYAEKRNEKEQQMALLRTVREKQYEAVEALYHVFSLFMSLYREINSSNTDLGNGDMRKNLLKRVIEAEAEVDALILRIGCEFAHASETELEDLLGHLRQSVQLWRETLQKGQMLPFYASDQPDYVRFKETFARTAAFMVQHIHEQLEPSKMRQEQAASILVNVFSNDYEGVPYKSIYHRKERLYINANTR